MGSVVKEDTYLKCIKCAKVFKPDIYLYKCPQCGSLLSIDYDLSRTNVRYWSDFKGEGMWRYKKLLPVKEDFKDIVTLNEGGTPLIKIRTISSVKAYIKFEGANPTGSFKDRGMSLAISLTKAYNISAVIAASTGNTAASLAAYAGRAGLKAIVVVPKGKVALGKLFQAILHGALIVEIRGNFDDALKVVMETTGRYPKLYPLNSFNPWRLEGQKTIAFEIAEGGHVPDWVIVPVGNAGNISAIWKGFKELKALGLISKLPRMVGVQAERAAPLAEAFERGLDTPIFIDNPETLATAIRIGKPVNWPKAMKAVKESKGLFIKVSDDEILNAMKYIARKEGICSEPAGAASVAGLFKLLSEKIIDKGERIVCIVTGHGLKDPNIKLDYVKITVSVNEAIAKIVSLAGIHSHNVDT